MNNQEIIKDYRLMVGGFRC